MIPSNRIGYSTATMDMFHQGHIRFIQTCRTLLPPGSTLIIGLTTDELAAKQKRPTTMSYEHRRAILLGFVDDVVPHTGDDKITAWKKLHFTDVFIGDEYFGKKEYEELKSIGVPVHYVPRHPDDHLSSSEIERQSAIRLAKQLTIISTAGPGGPILQLSCLPEPVIIKQVRVSQLEYEAGGETVHMRTANVYKLPIPNPRNFKKKGEVAKFPNIPGVNSYREIDIQPLITGKPWCTTTDVSLIRREMSTMPKVTAQPDWSHLNRDKDQPKEIYFIYQRSGGITLAAWIDQQCNETDFVRQLVDIIQHIRKICVELTNQAIVHGDLHTTNVCVSDKSIKTPEGENLKGENHKGKTSNIEKLSDSKKITIIDFGWCLHRSFYMDTAERDYYETCLRTNWDWKHFCDAFECAYYQEPWFSSLQIKQ